LLLVTVTAKALPSLMEQTKAQTLIYVLRITSSKKHHHRSLAHQAALFLLVPHLKQIANSSQLSIKAALQQSCPLRPLQTHTQMTLQTQNFLHKRCRFKR
jgi:hypothetical protein